MKLAEKGPGRGKGRADGGKRVSIPAQVEGDSALLSDEGSTYNETYVTFVTTLDALRSGPLR